MNENELKIWLYFVLFRVVIVIIKCALLRIAISYFIFAEMSFGTLKTNQRAKSTQNRNYI